MRVELKPEIVETLRVEVTDQKFPQLRNLPLRELRHLDESSRETKTRRGVQRARFTCVNTPPPPPSLPSSSSIYMFAVSPRLEEQISGVVYNWNRATTGALESGDIQSKGILPSHERYV